MKESLLLAPSETDLLTLRDRAIRSAALKSMCRSEVSGGFNAHSPAAQPAKRVRTDKMQRAREGLTGRWAVVTGAGSGIGRAIADRLGALGCNIVLAGRNADNLEAAAAALAAAHAVETLVYATDLSESGAAEALHVFCVSHGVEAEVLVNNAGTFIFNDLLKTSSERTESIINLHIVAFTALCRLFGGDMAARGHGHILNMASLSAWMHFPGISLYSATKAYVYDMSVCLSRELSEKGVTVTAVSPAGVATGLYGLPPRFQRLGRRLGVLLTPEKTARKAVRAMLRGRRHIVPGWYNRLLVPVLYLLPHAAVRSLRSRTMRFQK